MWNYWMSISKKSNKVKVFLGFHSSSTSAYWASVMPCNFQKLNFVSVGKKYFWGLKNLKKYIIQPHQILTACNLLCSDNIIAKTHFHRQLWNNFSFSVHPSRNIDIATKSPFLMTYRCSWSYPGHYYRHLLIISTL